MLTSSMSMDFMVSTDERVASLNFSTYLVSFIVFPLTTTTLTFSPLLHCLFLSVGAPSKVQFSSISLPKTAGFVFKLHEIASLKITSYFVKKKKVNESIQPQQFNMVNCFLFYFMFIIVKERHDLTGSKKNAHDCRWCYYRRRCLHIPCESNYSYYVYT